jgi:hypothetical protein
LAREETREEGKKTKNRKGEIEERRQNREGRRRKEKRSRTERRVNKLKRGEDFLVLQTDGKQRGICFEN